MRCDEHHSKLLFAEAGIPTPPGITVAPDDPALDTLVPPFPGPWYVKSQVLAGGRGKAGGIRRADTTEELRRACREILALPIGGRTPPFVRVEPGATVTRELYLSFAVSRGRESLALTVSRAGGMDVESDRAASLVQDVPLPHGPSPYQIRRAFFHLNLPRELAAGFEDILRRLYAAVRDYGLLLAEINPLAVTPDGLLALDGKVRIDDNVRDLRPELERFGVTAHATPAENAARAANMSFVTLGGFVGLVANGAGLAMATMDMLNLSGLPAANFLDLGGGADRERIRTALSLLFDDTNVTAVFVNLYGGILSCAKVAEALADVLDGKAPAKPLVLRMAGNGAAEARSLLEGLGLPDVTLVGDMAEGARVLARYGERVEPRHIAIPQPIPPWNTANGHRLDYVVFPLRPNPRVIVQGITGKTAALHARLMREYGTRIVAGVTPFKGGQEAGGVPVFNTVREAHEEHRADASVIFVPAAFAADAILEAADAGVPWIVCITEGIPQQDMLAILPRLRASGARLIGPNTPGLILPGRTKIGIQPAEPFTPGPVAVFSRSGTLTYEAARRLSEAGIGQHVCIGMGGDPFVGLRFTDLLEMVRDDPAVRMVLLLGEIGGRAEEDAAAYVLRTAYPKPVAAFIAGVTAPPGRRLGHAGAIIETAGGVEQKFARLVAAGVHVCPDLESIPALAARLLRRNAPA